MLLSPPETLAPRRGGQDVLTVIDLAGTLHLDDLGTRAAMASPIAAGLAPVHQDQRKPIALGSGHQAGEEGIPVATAAIHPFPLPGQASSPILILGLSVFSPRTGQVEQVLT